MASQLIETTVDQVSDVLDKNYVYPEVALEMNAYLKQQLLAGKYRNSSTLRKLIENIQLDLRKVSDDGHIDILLAEDSIDRTKK